jgi:TonB family protein
MDADVEILEKPKPDYSDEARRLRIEGDVVLRVTFEASGAIVVHGVLEGLGHGLDEAAMVAARRIKFKPARRNGEPVDLTAILRVVFRLT